MRLKAFLISIYLPIELFKKKLVVFLQAIGYSLRSYRLANKGQLSNYELLQLSHRLEKGMLNKTPKPFWGWEKANRIIMLLKNNHDEFSNQTALGVLKAYIDAKKNSNDLEERNLAFNFEINHPEICNVQTNGGIISLNKDDIIVKEPNVIRQFFQGRHSCRDFKDVIVSKTDINNAVSLALSCPSACNRQVTNCYVYQCAEYQTILLTVNIRAYDIGEFNDWFISPAIFAAYLSLTLHLYGIGSCIYRKQLFGHHDYNEEMRKKCKIQDDEMIVLELRFGYYKESFNVAVSNRHIADDIISFFKE